MAIFPGAVATDAGLYVAVNNLSTLLTDNPLTIGATTVNVVSTAGFPVAGAISIGAEIIFYTSTNATQFLGCTRGADGTSAAAHALNDQVDHNVIAAHHNVLKDEIIAIETYLSTHLGLATTVTSAEFERLSGVTSPIQTQLDGKEPTITVLPVAKGGTNSSTALSNNRIIRSLSGAIVEAAAITANRALASDANGIPVHTGVTDTELGHVSGVTSPIQTQLDGKVSDTGDTMTGDLNLSGNDLRGVGSLNDSGVFGFRNRFCNGEFRFDQRNEGTIYTINASSLRTLDMVFAEAPPADGVFTVQRQTSVIPPDFSHALRVEITSADGSVGAADNYDVRFCSEGNDVRDFLLGTASAKTFTVSFWVRSSITGTYGFRAGNSAFNRSYVGQYTINVADTWEYKTVTIPGDTTGTWETGILAGIRFQFDIGSGSSLEGTASAWQAGNFLRASGNVRLISTVSATWFLTGFQLELGSQASAFEYLPQSVAMARIQRYIEKTLPLGTAAVAPTGSAAGAITYRIFIAGTAGANGASWRFAATKRAAPTVTMYSSNSANSNWRNSTDGVDSGASAAVNAGTGGVYISNAQAAGDGVGESVQIGALATAEI